MGAIAGALTASERVVVGTEATDDLAIRATASPTRGAHMVSERGVRPDWDGVTQFE